MPITSAVGYIDALLNRFSWTGVATPNATTKTAIDYTFTVPASNQTLDTNNDVPNKAAITSGSQGDILALMTLWENVANVDFDVATSYNPASQQLVIAKAEVNPSSTTFGFFGTTLIDDSNPDTVERAEVYIDDVYTDYSVGNGRYVALHEIGHALGLDHPDHGSGLDPDYNSNLTVMSYNIAESRLAITPMIYDIAAVQYLYGANRDFNDGNNNYVFTDSFRAETIWDAGGNDTIDASGVTGDHVIDLRGGVDENGAPYMSEIGERRVAIAFDSENDSGVVDIEAAIGGDGDDTLIGGAIDNTLDGGAGNDTYIFSSEDSVDDTDTVIDSDGIGVLMFDGVSITGTAEEVEREANVFDTETFALETGGIEFTIYRLGHDIAITNDVSDHTVIVQDYVLNALGLTLHEQVPSDLPSASNDFFTHEWVIENTTGTAFTVKKYDTDEFALLSTDSFTGTVTGASASENVPLGDIFYFQGGTNANSYLTTVVINAGVGNDEINISGAGNATLDGGTGDDTIRGGAGDDSITGGADNDALAGGTGKDTIDGGSGDDTITGFLLGEETIPAWYTVADILRGGDGNDEIVGGNSNNSLEGGAGDDYLEMDGTGNTVSGGDGVDQVSFFKTTTALSLVLNENGSISGDTGTGNSFAAMEGISGTAFNDTISGNSGSNFLFGSDGNDSLSGNGGNDELYGYTGNDTLDGGLGADTIVGEDGADSIASGSGADSVDGGIGNDTITGLSGNDTIVAGEGADSVNGEADNDSITGGDGNDTLLGSSGNDTIYGGADQDSINAGSNDDIMYGEAGNDTLKGFDGADSLSGGADADDLRGENGNDTLDGGAGIDKLTGDAGSDVFVFSNAAHSVYSNPDRVMDFTKGTDIIDLSGLGFTGIQAGTGTGTVLGYVFSDATDRTYITNATNTFRITLEDTQVSPGVGITLTSGDFDFT